MHTGLEALLSTRREPATSDGDFLRTCVRAAGTFLATTSIGEFLRAVLPVAPASSGLSAATATIDHVGFIMPLHPRSVLELEARAGGFPLEHHVFESRVLARELAAHLGRAEVPTQVFKARGKLEPGAGVALELFMPDELESGEWRDLMACGLTLHVGLGLASREQFATAGEVLEGCGYHPPACLPEPLTNDGERVTVQYFDGRWRGEPLRLELCLDARARRFSTRNRPKRVQSHLLPGPVPG